MKKVIFYKNNNISNGKLIGRYDDGKILILDNYNYWYIRNICDITFFSDNIDVHEMNTTKNFIKICIQNKLKIFNGLKFEKYFLNCVDMSEKCGYHKQKIEKGVLGEFSKIKEEFEELQDAVEQDNKILSICELTDLIGAIKAYAQNYNITLSDLNIFSEATERAFKNGKR